MYKQPNLRLLSVLLIGIPVLFTACVKDNCERSRKYSYFIPVYQSKASVRENVKSHSPQAIKNPGKIYIKGNFIFLNEIDKGIHVIDNRNPSSPQNIGFISIPGNLDIAAKGNLLYADMFGDLVTLDISDPVNIEAVNFLNNVFPHRIYGGGFTVQNNGDSLIVDWIQKDTMVTEDCGNENWFMADLAGTAFFSSSTTKASPVGAGGSMARFAILNDYLYAVNYYQLAVFDISATNTPVHANQVNIGWNIETIFPFRDKLFIGSAIGMYIYDVTQPGSPALLSEFAHVNSCDPVIADEDYAYVTLRSGNVCQGFSNQLEVVDIQNLQQPQLKKVYPMTNPHGLSKDGDLLFIADGAAGLKVFNAANVMNIELLKTISGPDTYDVIAMNKIALLVAKDGLYQYDYSNHSNIRLLSKLGISPQ